MMMCFLSKLFASNIITNNVELRKALKEYHQSASVTIEVDDTEFIKFCIQQDNDGSIIDFLIYQHENKKTKDKNGSIIDFFIYQHENKKTSSIECLVKKCLSIAKYRLSRSFFSRFKLPIKKADDIELNDFTQ